MDFCLVLWFILIMKTVDAASIREAAGRIAPYVHRTPLIYSNSFSRLFGAEVYLKAENLQKTGSFKVRGAFNKLLRLKPERVIAASMGNHSQGVAFAASCLGIKAKIIMPVTTSIAKQNATRGYGAEVVLLGNGLSEAVDHAMSAEDYTFIHPFDDYDIIEGQGTLGLEIAEDLTDMDAVLVPVGGGGLLAGTALAVKGLLPSVKVIGVQTEKAVSASESFHSGRIVESVPQATIADGIAVGRIGDRPFEFIHKYADDIMVVKEESIARAVLLMLERKKLVVEGAGAVPAAALLEQRTMMRGKRIVLVLSGGNIDFTLIDRMIQRGLAAGGRIGTFRLIVDDEPGGLHRLTGVVSEEHANILEIVHERLHYSVPIGKTVVGMTVEVRDREHLEELSCSISDAGFVIIERT